MKVVSTEALTKLIQLVKSAFVKVEDVVETEEVTLADVATSGDYDDLINKPTIPTATSDLTNDSGYITSSALTPYVLSADLASVATSGSYNDLSNKPTIPTVNNATLTITQGGVSKGTFTANASSDVTVDLDSGGSSLTAGIGIDITNDVIGVTSDIATGAALGAIAVQPSDLATVATSGSYNDLSDKPTIPAAQVNSDWNATSGVAQILNKPTIPTVPTNVSAFTNDAGYITNSALSGYATESYVTTAVSGKQDTLVSGTGIDITNDVISVEGVKDQRNTSTAIKTWTGTRAQYDAIATKDNNTLYNITDDSDTTLPLLEALYPVGSVYITTASTCPLSTLISGSTWVEETSRILVDKYVSGTDWWELYSDGWCRQGGVIQMPGSGVTKTLLKSYKDTNYNVLLTCGSNTTGWPIAWTNNPSKTNSSFNMDGTGNSGGAERTIQVNWEACGYTSTTTTYKRFRRTL